MIWILQKSFLFPFWEEYPIRDNMTRGHKCDYRKQVSETKLDGAVIEVLRKLVSNKKFAGMMREKINMEVDTSSLDQEIATYEKALRQCYLNKDAILADLDNLDYEDKHYQRRKTDLENRLSKTCDIIEEAENSLVEAKSKKRSILAEKVCGDNIYKALIFFDKMYEPMNEAERREFLTQFIEKVEIYVCPEDSPELKRHLAFRDYLRMHPEAAIEYGRIKTEAAKRYPEIDQYIAYKAPRIEKIMLKMGN